MALPSDQSLIDLATRLNISYEVTFKGTTPPSTAPELDAAINAIYEQIPPEVKATTREVKILQKMSMANSYAAELLSELPRLVLDSDLSPAKKRALLTAIKDLYRRYLAD